MHIAAAWPLNSSRLGSVQSAPSPLALRPYGRGHADDTTASLHLSQSRSRMALIEFQTAETRGAEYGLTRISLSEPTDMGNQSQQLALLKARVAVICETIARLRLECACRLPQGGGPVRDDGRPRAAAADGEL